MTLNKVVLPAPFGPISPVIPVGATSRSTSLRATKPPKRTVTPRAPSSGSDTSARRRRGASGSGRQPEPVAHAPPVEDLLAVLHLLEAHARQPVGFAGNHDHAECDAERQVLVNVRAERQQLHELD